MTSTGISCCDVLASAHMEEVLTLFRPLLTHTLHQQIINCPPSPFNVTEDVRIQYQIKQYQICGEKTEQEWLNQDGVLLADSSPFTPNSSLHPLILIYSLNGKPCTKLQLLLTEVKVLITSPAINIIITFGARVGPEITQNHWAQDRNTPWRGANPSQVGVMMDLMSVTEEDGKVVNLLENLLKEPSTDTQPLIFVLLVSEWFGWNWITASIRTNLLTVQETVEGTLCPQKKD
ncbi:uncharacterized protein [Hoplias malabaricus]|uniref:uncharacterized protein n=1 Tax=Hoplias malabaricus TaxID=27720 RepID=UPI003461E9A0